MNGSIKVKNLSGATVLEGDSKGNLLLKESLTVGQGSNGIIEVKNASGATTFSATTKGTVIKDGTMRITSGTITPSGGISYPEGSENITTLKGNGIETETVTYSGSQVYRNVVEYYSNGVWVTEDNSGNSSQRNRTVNVSASGIAFDAPTTDASDGAPWYGVGRAKSTLGGVGQAVQVAGYYGLRLRSDGTVIDLPFSGEPSVNRGMLFNGWVRPRGQNGLYFQDYGGGWHMTEPTWIRAYGGKSIATTGGMSADEGIWSGGDLQAANNIVMQRAGQYSWILHRPNTGNNLTMARSTYWGGDGGTWNWDYGFDFNPDLSGGPGIHFGTNGPHIKGLLSSTQQVQARNRFDTGYVNIVAYGFLSNASKSSDIAYNSRTFARDPDIIDILKKNHIVDYSVPTAACHLKGLPHEDVYIDMEYTEKSNFIIDMMTPEARELLVCECGDNESAIDLNKMTQTIWKACQIQQETIEQLEAKNKDLEDRLARIEAFLNI